MAWRRGRDSSGARATAGWAWAGPLGPGWARRAGTPAALLARSSGNGTAASALRVFTDDVRTHERGPCLAARGHPVFAVPSGPAGAAMAQAQEARR